jgi:hypothetical protein
MLEPVTYTGGAVIDFYFIRALEFAGDERAALAVIARPRMVCTRTTRPRHRSGKCVDGHCTVESAAAAAETWMSTMDIAMSFAMRLDLT